MIAPFNFKKLENKILITNDLGRYDFLSKLEFERYVNQQIEKETELYNRLKNNFFLYDSSTEEFLGLVKSELRYGKSYLFSATSLHIFVVTNFCNAKCIYCQAQSGNLNSCKMMTEEIAKKAVDFALQSPQRELTFEFQGGEPLSNYNIIKFIVEYTNSIKMDKIIHYSVVSNLTLLTEEMITFFKENSVSISTSLDGDQELHSSNRPLSVKKDSYGLLKEKLYILKDNQMSYGAIQTTTKKSLSKSHSIIDEYIACELDNIFLRPLTPLGYA